MQFLQDDKGFMNLCIKQMQILEHFQDSVEYLIFSPLVVYILQFCKHTDFSSLLSFEFTFHNCDKFVKTMASRLKLLAPNQLIIQVTCYQLTGISAKS